MINDNEYFAQELHCKQLKINTKGLPPEDALDLYMHTHLEDESRFKRTRTRSIEEMIEYAFAHFECEIEELGEDNRVLTVKRRKNV